MNGVTKDIETLIQEYKLVLANYKAKKLISFDAIEMRVRKLDEEIQRARRKARK